MKLLFLNFTFICGMLAQETFIQSGNEIKIIGSQRISDNIARSYNMDTKQIDKTQKYVLPIKFDPLFVEFNNKPAGMPFTAKVLIWNLNPKAIKLESITNLNPNFFVSKVAQHIIEPGHNTSFMIIYLARGVEYVETDLVVSTSLGEYHYKATGNSVTNPYRVKAYYKGHIPYDAIFTPVIAMFNPHNYAIQISEIWTSSYDFHLELPYGFGVNIDKIWRIPPFHTKPLVVSNYLSKSATQYPNISNVSCYLSIKIEHLTSSDNYTNDNRDPETLWNGPNTSIDDYLMERNDEVIVIPFDIQLTSEPGLYSPIDVYDFGTLSTYDYSKSLNLKLFHVGQDPIEITSVKLKEQNEAVHIDFSPRVIPPNTKKPVWLGKLSFIAFKAIKPHQSYGLIEFLSNSTAHQITVPFYANLFRGALIYDVNATKLNVPPPSFQTSSPPHHMSGGRGVDDFTAASQISPPIRSYLSLKNTFDFPLAISDVYIVQDEVDKSTTTDARKTGGEDDKTGKLVGKTTIKVHSIRRSSLANNLSRHQRAGSFRVGNSSPDNPFKDTSTPSFECSSKGAGKPSCSRTGTSCQGGGGLRDNNARDDDIWSYPLNSGCHRDFVQNESFIIIPPKGTYDLIYVEYQPFSHLPPPPGLNLTFDPSSGTDDDKRADSSWGDNLNRINNNNNLRYVTASLNIQTNTSKFKIPISVYYGGLQIETYNVNPSNEDEWRQRNNQGSQKTLAIKFPTLEYRIYPEYFYYYLSTTTDSSSPPSQNDGDSRKEPPHQHPVEKFKLDSDFTSFSFLSLYNHYPYALNLSSYLRFKDGDEGASKGKLNPQPPIPLSHNSKILAKSFKLCPVAREYLYSRYNSYNQFVVEKDGGTLGKNVDYNTERSSIPPSLQKDDSKSVYRERLLFGVSQKLENVIPKSADDYNLTTVRKALNECRDGLKAYLTLLTTKDSSSHKYHNNMEIKAFQVLHFIAEFAPLKFIGGYKKVAEKSAHNPLHHHHDYTYETSLEFVLTKDSDLPKNSNNDETNVAETEHLRNPILEEETLKLKVRVRSYEKGFLKLSQTQSSDFLYPKHQVPSAWNISTNSSKLSTIIPTSNAVTQNYIDMSALSSYPGKITRFNVYIDNYYDNDDIEGFNIGLYGSSTKPPKETRLGNNDMTIPPGLTVTAVKPFIRDDALPKGWGWKNQFLGKGVGSKTTTDGLPNPTTFPTFDDYAFLINRVFTYHKPDSISSTGTTTTTTTTTSDASPSKELPTKNKRVRMAPFTKHNYIGQIRLNPSYLCTFNDDYCYTGIDSLDEEYNPWFETFTKPQNIFEVDLPLYLKRLTKWKNLIKHNLDSLTTAFQVDTNRDEDVLQFYVQGARLIWPKLITTDVLNFPLTRVGNYSAAVIIIRNPSFKSLLLQILPLNVLSANKATIDDLLVKTSHASIYGEDIDLDQILNYNTSDNGEGGKSDTIKIIEEENPFELAMINMDFYDELDDYYDYSSRANDDVKGSTGQDDDPTKWTTRNNNGFGSSSTFFFKVLRHIFGLGGGGKSKSLRYASHSGSRSSSIFSHRRGMGGRRLGSPLSEPLKYHPSTLAFVLEPYKEAKFFVKFMPKTDALHETHLVIRNNLTFLETIRIRGKGALGSLELMEFTQTFVPFNVPGVTPVLRESANLINTWDHQHDTPTTSPSRFKEITHQHQATSSLNDAAAAYAYNPINFLLGEIHLQNCIDQDPITVFYSFRKNLGLKNTGDLPVKIVSIRVEPYPSPSFLLHLTTMADDTLSLLLPSQLKSCLDNVGSYLVSLFRPFSTFFAAFRAFYRLDVFLRLRFPWKRPFSAFSNLDNNNSTTAATGGIKQPFDCKGYGFNVPDCSNLIDFVISPNQTKKIDLIFSPDFSVTKTHKTLVIETTTNIDSPPSPSSSSTITISPLDDLEFGGHDASTRLLRYELLATVPLHLSKLCSRKVLRPVWEIALYYCSLISMSILLLMVVVVSWIEADRLSGFHFLSSLSLLRPPPRLIVTPPPPPSLHDHRQRQRQSKNYTHDHHDISTGPGRPLTRHAATKTSTTPTNAAVTTKDNFVQLSTSLPLEKRIPEKGVNNNSRPLSRLQSLSPSNNNVTTTTPDLLKSKPIKQPPYVVSTANKNQTVAVTLNEKSPSNNKTTLTPHAAESFKEDPPPSNSPNSKDSVTPNIPRSRKQSVNLVSVSINVDNNYRFEKATPGKNQNTQKVDSSGNGGGTGSSGKKKKKGSGARSQALPAQSKPPSTTSQLPSALSFLLTDTAALPPTAVNKSNNNHDSKVTTVSKTSHVSKVPQILRKISIPNNTASPPGNNIPIAILTRSTSLENSPNYNNHYDSTNIATTYGGTSSKVINLGGSHVNDTPNNKLPLNAPAGGCGGKSPPLLLELDYENSERSSTPTNITYADVLSSKRDGGKSSTSSNSNSRSLTPIWDMPDLNTNILVKNIDVEFSKLADKTAQFHLRLAHSGPENNEVGFSHSTSTLKNIMTPELEEEESDNGPVTPLKFKNTFNSNELSGPWIRRYNDSRGSDHLNNVFSPPPTSSSRKAHGSLLDATSAPNSFPIYCGEVVNSNSLFDSKWLENDSQDRLFSTTKYSSSYYESSSSSKPHLRYPSDQEEDYPNAIVTSNAPVSNDMPWKNNNNNANTTNTFNFLTTANESNGANGNRNRLGGSSCMSRSSSWDSIFGEVQKFQQQQDNNSTSFNYNNNNNQQLSSPISPLKANNINNNNGQQPPNATLSFYSLLKSYLTDPGFLEYLKNDPDLGSRFLTAAENDFEMFDEPERSLTPTLEGCGAGFDNYLNNFKTVVSQTADGFNFYTPSNGTMSNLNTMRSQQLGGSLDSIVAPSVDGDRSVVGGGGGGGIPADIRESLRKYLSGLTSTTGGYNQTLLPSSSSHREFKNSNFEDKKQVTRRCQEWLFSANAEPFHPNKR